MNSLYCTGNHTAGAEYFVSDLAFSGVGICFATLWHFGKGRVKHSDHYTKNGKGKEEKMDFSVLGKTAVSSFNSFYSLLNFATKGCVTVRPGLP